MSIRRHIGRKIVRGAKQAVSTVGFISKVAVGVALGILLFSIAAPFLLP